MPRCLTEPRALSSNYLKGVATVSVKKRVKHADEVPINNLSAIC
jgi:hypothetical protein